MEKDLFPCLKVLPTDYDAYGGEVKRWADPELDYPDCASGCRFFVPLTEPYTYDWGVCAKPGSPRAGMLTWERGNVDGHRVLSVRRGLVGKLTRLGYAGVQLFRQRWRPPDSIPDYRSTLYSGEGIDLDIAPGPYGIRIRNAVSEPSLEFRSLPIGERCGGHVANSKTREDSMLGTGNVAPRASGRQEMLKNVINLYP